TELRGQIANVQTQAQAAAVRLKEEEALFQSLKARLDQEKDGIHHDRQALAQRQSTVDLAGKKEGQARADLVRLTRDLEQMEQTLQALQALRQREKKMYSLVPYRGRRGDNRQPIYLECAADGLIFHPDRKALVGLSFNPGEIHAEVEHRVEAMVR